jgi:hypothetical protein
MKCCWGHDVSAPQSVAGRRRRSYCQRSRPGVIPSAKMMLDPVEVWSPVVVPKGPPRYGEWSVCHPPQWCVHAPVTLEELVLPFAQKWRIYRIKKLWCPSSWRAKCRCVSTKITGSTRPRFIGFMGACYNSSLHGDLKSMVKYQRGFRQVEAAQMLTILRHVGDVFLWEAHEDG